MPPEFYPRDYTDASRRVLEQLLESFPEAIVIGGWASWARTGVLQSHDIDLIVGPDLLPSIEEKYGPVTPSSHIGGKKWRGEFEGIHLDLYLPYQSRLGSRLKLRVEALVPYAERVDGWLLLALPAHLATKFAALLDRPESLPGEKDRHEIWGLMEEEVSAEEVATAMTASELEPMNILAAMRDAFTLLGDLELTRQQRQRLRRQGSDFVEALQRIFGA